MDEDELKTALIELKEQHRDLDNAITALDETRPFNQLQIQRLKRRKLALKDKINLIENKLLPNIIA